MFKIIPLENPRLDLKTYTKIFDHLFNDVKDYKMVKLALNTYPRYLINNEHLLEMLTKAITTDEKLA
jgi:hypothetical protein